VIEEFVLNINNLKPLVKGDGPIVVVDDDPAQIDLIQIFYEKSNRKNPLICMKTGEEFLSYCHQVLQANAIMPELVLLDINMPKMSGFDVLKKLRSISEFAEIPFILMFSSSDSDRDKEQAKNLKANAYFSKPVKSSDYVKFFDSI